MSKSTAAVAVAGVVMLATAVAGCSDDKGSAHKTPSAHSTAKVSATPLPPEPTFAGTPAGAVVDVKLTDCKTSKGKQTAKGTVTNSSSKDRDYAIYVMWMKNGDGTPYGSALVTLHGVKPKTATQFEASATVATDTDKCVLNVHAGTLK